ncbi:beta-ketoacyl-[acyl-carrier-protein] synthase family protein [Thermosporothrix hazakensis]|nr:beta-ketoacyl-[acyl-carrier-protein] synthase family protein [Thermosporothrix hazakensis]BBH89883.1 3-oxoacyl-[acyl-carrier-protein] synthase 2 [Thermosporothrix sp. COM3]GCE48079.1 3-oxoacyl-[acyl-carrier-protein] synthase 2 [Thermosporothrix hazakensis]
MQTSKRRVVVTGMGAITPLGNSVESFWLRLCQGHSGIGRITQFDASRFQTQIAAEVRNLTLPPFLDEKLRRRLPRFALFALLAALEAWQDAGLHTASFDPCLAGVSIGSSHGGEEFALAGAAALQTQSPISPYIIPGMLSSRAAAQIALHFGLHGPTLAPNAACATGAQAIGEGAERIRHGDADIMLCGGAEACITPLTLAGDQATGALSRHNNAPEEASRPFDLKRDGFVPGEGAGILVLEAYEHACTRHAPIYAELKSYACTIDATHMTRPDPEGTYLALAIRQALQKANLHPASIHAIFAHATGTRLGDTAEAMALLQAFGPTLAHIPVTAIKASLGHLLGASGAVQGIAGVQALQKQCLPPTITLTEVDPTCAHLELVRHTRAHQHQAVLSCSSGFGGYNVALIFSRCE